MTPRLVLALAIVACLQLSAVALLYWPPGQGAADANALDPPLLALPRESIAGISVTGPAGEEVSITRRGGQWLLEDGLPAAASLIDSLLEALNRPLGFPVARSDSARMRFELAQTAFQRRITLESETDSAPTGDRADAASTIYLGTSPGIRQVYARRGDSDAIHAIKLSTFDVPTRVDRWLEPNLLALAAIDRVRIDGDEWTKTQDSWAPVAGQTAEEETATRLQVLEQALATLQVTGVVPADASVPDAAEIVFTVWQSGREHVFQLQSAADGEESRIYSSERGRWFTLASYDVDRLADALAALKTATGKTWVSRGRRNGQDSAQ